MRDDSDRHLAGANPCCSPCWCHNSRTMVVHVPPNEMLVLGLALIKKTVRNPAAPRSKQNNERFLACFGTTPEAASTLFGDLQTTNIMEARIESICFKYFMMTLNWIKSNKLQPELAGTFEVHEDTVRKWTWFYIKRIQALKEVKIRWDVLNGSPYIVQVSDDGVHCRINEPRKQPSTKWSSKKYGKKAAVTYEIGIAIHHNQVVLINGPHPAAMHDMTMFNSAEGVGARLPPGAKAVADRAYSGDQVCVRNEFDSDEVKQSKKRTRARHETFNGRIKSFHILDERFRLGVQKHKAVFEACCVIVQYDMDTGRPLFRVH